MDCSVTPSTSARDRAVWGPEPFGFHPTSVLLHMLNVALLVLLAIVLCSDAEGRGTAPASAVRGTTVGFMAALISAAHPVMSGAVGYISSRSDLLCTTLLINAFLTGRRWLQPGHGRARSSSAL